MRCDAACIRRAGKQEEEEEEEKHFSSHLQEVFEVGTTFQRDDAFQFNLHQLAHRDVRDAKQTVAECIN